MDFNTLTPENQKKYLALEKKMFAPKKPKLVSACHILHIYFYEGMMWYSHMLKNHASPIEKTDVAIPVPAHLMETCPTCGKTKYAVNDMKTCRDVFHYL